MLTPDKFDGTSIEWPVYRAHFDVIAEVNGWSKREQGVYLAGSLTGEARRMLTSLSPADRRDSDVLTDKLTLRFDPDCQEESYKATLGQRTRRKAETPQQYGYELQRLAGRGYPDLNSAAQEAIALDHFWKGHPDGDMKVMALMRKMKTMEEAIAFVTQYECVKPKPGKPVMSIESEDSEPALGRVLQLLKNQQGGETTTSGQQSNQPNVAGLPRLPYFKGLFESQDRKLDRLIELCEQVLSIKPRAATAENKGPSARPGPDDCWYCGKPGHRKYQCPDRPPPRTKEERLSRLIEEIGERNSLTDEESENQ